MGSPAKLIKGSLVKRYKRFLADVELEDGRVVTVHCPNSGSMKACLGDGWPVLLSQSDNPNRKLPMTLEWIHNSQTWIGVNTHRANHLVGDFLARGLISSLSGYSEHKPEVRISDKSRIDWVLRSPQNPELPDCFIEVKSVTLLGHDGLYQFPDSVTSRGTKHLHELIRLVGEGNRAVMIFLVCREDGTFFRAAKEIDPLYAKTLEEAKDAGVEILVCATKARPPEVEYAGLIPMEWK